MYFEEKTKKNTVFFAIYISIGVELWRFVWYCTQMYFADYAHFCIVLILKCLYFAGDISVLCVSEKCGKQYYVGMFNIKVSHTNLNKKGKK